MAGWIFKTGYGLCFRVRNEMSEMYIHLKDTEPKLGAQTTNNVWYVNRNKAHVIPFWFNLSGGDPPSSPSTNHIPSRASVLTNQNTLRAGLRAPLFSDYKYTPPRSESLE